MGKSTGFTGRVQAETRRPQRGSGAIKTTPGNLNREICEKREKQEDEEVSRGDAPPSLKLRRTGENAEEEGRISRHSDRIYGMNAIGTEFWN